MTTQPKRLTAEEEAREIIDTWFGSDDPTTTLKLAIAAALRKRDELADVYWRECQAWRDYEVEACEHACDPPIKTVESTDQARRAAGLEDA